MSKYAQTLDKKEATLDSTTSAAPRSEAPLSAAYATAAGMTYNDLQPWSPGRAAVTGPFYSTSARVNAEYKAIGVNIRRRAGAILFAEGELPTAVWVVRLGRIKLTTLSREGKTLLVRIAKPGDVLGLSAAVSETRFEVTAQALEDTLLRAYQQRDFLNFIRNNADGGLYAAERLADEYRSVFSDVCRLTLSISIPSRMAHLLLGMLVESETPEAKYPVVDLPLTHQDIAAMLGSSRETVTRTLNKFKRSGILAINGRNVTILRRSILEAMI
jgi:CRP/FNR family cyclic AMP-dependent transcriptional regulator